MPLRLVIDGINDRVANTAIEIKNSRQETTPHLLLWLARSMNEVGVKPY